MNFQFIRDFYRITILLINCYIYLRGNKNATRFEIRFFIIYKYLDIIT